MDAVLTSLLSLLCFFLPGFLLYPLLRPYRVGRVASIGIAIALQTVWFTALASIWRYHWLLQAISLLIFDLLLIWKLWQTRQLQQIWQIWRLPLQAWQWALCLSILLVYLAPITFLPVPMDVDAQGFGYLVLTVRESGSIFSLAPFYPNIGWFYSPAFFLFPAFLSDISGTTITASMFGFSHLLALGLVAGIGSLGRRMAGEMGGWWAGFFAAAGMAIYTSLLDSAYTSMLGIWNTVTFLYCMDLLLAQKERRATLLLWFSALSLGSVLLAHPDSIIQLLIVYIPFYLSGWLALPRFNKTQYIRLIFWVPLLGVLICLPWLSRSLWLVPHIDVHERQMPALRWLNWMVLVNGVLPFVLAVLGGWWAGRKRHWLDIWNITWMLAVIEFAALGNLDKLSLQTSLDPMKVFYPFGIAWHAPIVPVPLLAMRTMQAVSPTLARWLAWKRWRTPVLFTTLALLTLAFTFHQPILRWLKGAVRPIVGAVATPADLQAYRWVRENTPTTARLLNYPGTYEGQWVPVLTERYAVFSREQLFFTHAAPLFAEWERFTPVFLDPQNPTAQALLCEHPVDYIVVPQLLNRPQLFEQQYRLRPPDYLPQVSWFAHTDYLTLQVDFDGAQVWKISCE
ncbi:MAG TPA: hypothetical protein PK299_09395 [Anaerolineales bacterium]|nr:hypothetical protein [Anaerolineales bacterium]